MSEFVEVTGAEDDAGGAWRAALIDRNQALCELAAHPPQVTLLQGEPSLGDPHLAGKRRGALLTARPAGRAQLLLAGAGGACLLLGGRELALARLQLGRKRASRTASPFNLCLQGGRYRRRRSRTSGTTNAMAAEPKMSATAPAI